MTDYLCSLIKLHFAFIVGNCSTQCVLLLFMLKIIYFKKVLESSKIEKKKKKMHNRHRQKREKRVIDHSTGDKN